MLSSPRAFGPRRFTTRPFLSTPKTSDQLLYYLLYYYARYYISIHAGDPLRSIAFMGKDLIPAPSAIAWGRGGDKGTFNGYLCHLVH